MIVWIVFVSCFDSGRHRPGSRLALVQLDLSWLSLDAGCLAKLSQLFAVAPHLAHLQLTSCIADDVAASDVIDVRLLSGVRICCVFVARAVLSRETAECYKITTN